MLGLHRHFHELATIRRKQGGGVVPPQTLPPLADGHLAQGVEISAHGPAKGDFRSKKQVDLAIERAFWPFGPLGHGFDQAMSLGEPVDNQAGFRETGDADHDGFRGLHERKIMEGFGKNEPVPSIEGGFWRLDTQIDQNPLKSAELVH